MNFLLIIFSVLGVAAGFEDVTVVKWLSDHGYSICLQIVRAAGMEQELSTSGPFTIFAPSDAVFRQSIDQSQLTALYNDQSDAERWVKYHVVKEYLLVSMITGAAKHTTLSGLELTLRQSHGGAMINDGTKILGSSDNLCNNGVVQPINGLLAPPPNPADDMTIAQILVRDTTTFRDFTLFLLMNNMLHILDSGEYTVFAPTNAAFAPFAALGTPGPSGQSINSLMMDVFNNHIVPGKRTTAMLRNGQTIYSLRGTPLNVTKSATGDVMVNYAHVISPDMNARNGVIHAIDQVLVPTDVIMKILNGPIV